jgi:hypothetical protein
MAKQKIEDAIQEVYTKPLVPLWPTTAITARHITNRSLQRRPARRDRHRPQRPASQGCVFVAAQAAEIGPAADIGGSRLKEKGVAGGRPLRCNRAGGGYDHIKRTVNIAAPPNKANWGNEQSNNHN